MKKRGEKPVVETLIRLRGETGFAKIKKKKTGEFGRSILHVGEECQVGVRSGVNLIRRLQLQVPLDWHCIIKVTVRNL